MKPPLWEPPSGPYLPVIRGVPWQQRGKHCVFPSALCVSASLKTPGTSITATSQEETISSTIAVAVGGVSGPFGCRSSGTSRGSAALEERGRDVLWGRVVGQRASEAASAYLIRSRPSGKKINRRACCYCRARGRAATRAQHNIYTAGPGRHTTSRTHAQPSAHIPEHM